MPATKADILEAEDPARGINLRVPCFTEVDEEKLRDQIERDHFFWLDIAEPTEADIERLGDVFGFHPLALEDSLHFGQRFLFILARQDDNEFVSAIADEAIVFTQNLVHHMRDFAQRFGAA